MAISFFGIGKEKLAERQELINDAIRERIIDNLTTSSTATGTMTVTFDGSQIVTPATPSLIDKSRPVWYKIAPGNHPSHYGNGWLQSESTLVGNGGVNITRYNVMINVGGTYTTVYANEIKPLKQ